MLAGVSLLAGLSYALGSNLGLEPAGTIRLTLWSVIGGLMSYLYTVLGLPGTTTLLTLGGWGALLSILVGGAFGLGLCWWRMPAVSSRG